MERLRSGFWSKTKSGVAQVVAILLQFLRILGIAIGVGISSSKKLEFEVLI
jgi:hypothetical protein